MSLPTVTNAAPTAGRRRRSWLASAATLAVVATVGMGVSGWSATAQAVNAPTWRIQPTPGATGSGFQSISCATATTCVAVGDRFLGSSVTAVAETETAGVWSADSVPQQAGASISELDSVSCATTTRCVAVGSTTTGNRTRPFTEVLRFGKWTILGTAPLAGVAGADLASVSCTEASDCRAVGSWYPPSGNAGTLVETYNGTSWKLDKTLALDGAASFSGVSCLPATVPALCTAVGELTVDSRSTPLVEHGNGYDWTVVKVPTVTSSNETSLNSVSCPQPTSCVAVGTTLEGSNFRSISEIDDLGRWTLALNPHVSSTDYLSGVSCPLTIDSCRAVGFSGLSGTFTLAETWNGAHWSVQTSATPSSDLAELLAVSCVTVGSDGADCAAVGEYQDDPMAPSKLLAERNWS